MVSTTSSLIGKWNTDNMPANMIRNVYSLCSAAQSYTSNTTLAAVPGLAAYGAHEITGQFSTGLLVAGATYVISGHINGTSGASGGIKLTLNGGTATATTLYMNAINYNGATINAVTNTTALSSSIGNATAIYTDVYFDGVLVVNAAGTLIVQAAQNASNGTATTITTTSYLCVERIA